MTAHSSDQQTLHNLLETFQYPPRTPWVERLDITAKDRLPDFDVHNDLEREVHL